MLIYKNDDLCCVMNDGVYDLCYDNTFKKIQELDGQNIKDISVGEFIIAYLNDNGEVYYQTTEPDDEYYMIYETEQIEKINILQNIVSIYADATEITTIDDCGNISMLDIDIFSPNKTYTVLKSSEILDPIKVISSYGNLFVLDNNEKM